MSVISSLIAQNSDNFESVWTNLNRKIMSSNPTKGQKFPIFKFILLLFCLHRRFIFDNSSTDEA